MEGMHMNWNVTRISTNLSDLQGNGVEYLVDASGAVIAKFVNGNMPTACECLLCSFETSEKTKPEPVTKN